jgi:hypothetical protein
MEDHMTDSTVYHADGRSRNISSPADKVAAAWDGFVLTENPSGSAESSDKVDYRELQAKAKEAGIPANQSADDLQKALSDFEAEGGAPAASADASGTGTGPITDNDVQDNAHN